MEKKRPKLPETLTEGEIKEEELFQNMVLRPIIKMQHSLLILRVKSYFKSKRVIFNLMDNKKRTEAIVQAFQSDNSLKKEIQGMITGQLSLVEFQQYLKSERSLNKRIFQMVRNRMIDSLFELG
ncbi:MAG: glyoxalase [Flavobacteriales bacterium]|nr:MAG: glyoxalase [Flavobacteriales bacterium]